MPVDVALFAVLGAHLHDEGPPGAGQGGLLRRLARSQHGRAGYRGRAAFLFPGTAHARGALRVGPHRLWRTYGTELAATGIDVLVLRELMGHASRKPPPPMRAGQMSTSRLSMPQPGQRWPVSGERRGIRDGHHPRPHAAVGAHRALPTVGPAVLGLDLELATTCVLTDSTTSDKLPNAATSPRDPRPS